MIVLLSGGVGGAKLAEGLAAVIAPEQLAVIGNTGDDLEWCGLHICPDLDIVMYTLAGLVNGEVGWGIRDDTFHALEMLKHYGQPEWFRMGDRDLATALVRTRWLREGLTLTEVTRRLSRALGVQAHLIPMSNSPVRTKIQTPQRELDFQEYFVAHKSQDIVVGVRFDGHERAQPSPQIPSLLQHAEMIIIAPSNPLVSVGPILAIPGMREALAKSPAVKVGVSPLIAGKTIKGPLAEMMRSLGHRVDAVGVAALYRGMLDVFVIDQVDGALADQVEAVGVRVEVRQTIMENAEAKRNLAAELVAMRKGVRT